jgi:hypothetical protein
MINQAIKQTTLLLLLLVFSKHLSAQQAVLEFGKPGDDKAQTVTLSGRILDAGNKAPIPGAVLRLQPLDQNAVSEADGSFQLRLRAGVYALDISFLGFAIYKTEVRIYKNATHDFLLIEEALELRQVTVSESRADENVSSVMGSVEQLSLEKMERQAKFLGEMDVLRSLQSVSGVTSVGEGASGFNVRGGNTDENLILMEGNLVFNPVHALGFFSLFHPDMVQGVTLYKGGVPAHYGGRLSSVLDVKLREGDKQQFSAKGGVGVASSRLVLEGPLVKDKASFIAGARASYVDWILKQTRNVDLRKSRAFFYDFTAKADARLTEKTRLSVTAFNTHDDFRFADEVKFEYATSSAAFQLRQLVGEKINLTASANAGQYQSDLFDINGNDQSRFTNKIKYLRGSLRAFYQPLEAIQMEIGAEQSRYQVSPGQLTPMDSSSLLPRRLPSEQGSESSLFFHSQWVVSSRVELMAGLRYSQFDNFGPSQVYFYTPDFPKTAERIIDSLQIDAGEQAAGYSGLEPRLSLRVSLGPANSVKLGYNRSFQFLSQVSNTASATPIDIWQLSNYHIQPQYADNASLGYYHNFRENTIQSYLTLFYREIRRLIEYRDFARLLLNQHIETELLEGTGKAYGVELYFAKTYGQHRFEGNYTFSRSLRRVQGSQTQVAVNRGEWYPSNYDKPHSLNLNYFLQIRPRSSLSVNFTYSTGRPTTAPVSSFSSSNALTIPVYSQRNQFRIPDYHRLDLAYSVGPWGKRDRWRNSLTLSIYNLYFRRNAFSVFFRQNPFSNVTAYRVAVLGTMFPAVTYDFKF